VILNDVSWTETSKRSC